jgi:hypothetical protein
MGSYITLIQERRPSGRALERGEAIPYSDQLMGDPSCFHQAADDPGNAFRHARIHIYVNISSICTVKQSFYPQSE